MKKIENVIKAIRESFDGSVEVYTKGSCIRFAMILKEIFPKGEILYNENHAVFKYQGDWYDIHGAKGMLTMPNTYMPLEDYGSSEMKERMALKANVTVDKGESKYVATLKRVGKSDGIRVTAEGYDLLHSLCDIIRDQNGLVQLRLNNQLFSIGGV